MDKPFFALIVPQDALPPETGGGDEHPAHPIVIPPDLIAPGVPTHPIYIPVYPAHPIVIPPGAIGPGQPAHPIVLPPLDPAHPEHPIVIPPGSVGPGIPTHPIELPPAGPGGPPDGGDNNKPSPSAVIKAPLPMPEDVPEGAKVLLVQVPGYGWQWVVVPPSATPPSPGGTTGTSNPPYPSGTSNPPYPQQGGQQQGGGMNPSQQQGGAPYKP